MKPCLARNRLLLPIFLMALQGFSGCSANPTAEQDVISDAVTDQADNQGSGDAGDEFGDDGFAEEAPVPAPESLPPEVAESPDLKQAETVDALASKIEAQGDPGGEAFADAQAAVMGSQAATRMLSQAPAAEGRAAVQRGRRRYRSRPVSVRSRPFESNGSVLNAYYFSRTDDSGWVDLAQKLYGDPSRAEDLKIWNGGSALVPGTLIYYSSPVRPGDMAEMKSHAQDSGAGTEGYAVRRGDTLSRIAAIRYGGSQSWKEIAAENPELRNPDQIDPGMRIQLPPIRFPSAATLAPRKILREPEPVPAPAVAPAPVPARAAVEAVAESASAPAIQPRWVESIRMSPQLLAGALGILLVGALLLRRRAA